jgi:hypothetical protein
MFEKSNRFLEENKELILIALEKNPELFLEVFFKHPVFSMNFEISGLQPLEGPKGLVFYPTIKNERGSTA